MSEPRVLLVTSDYPPKLGGVAAYYYGLAQAMPSMYILTNIPGSSGPRVNQASWNWFGWPRWLPLLWVVPWWRAKTKARFLAAGELLPTGTALLLMRLAFSWPYLVFLHGLDVQLAQRSPWKKFLVRQVLSRAAVVVTNSRFTQELALQAGARESAAVVVYPGTDLIVAPAAAGDGIKQRYGLTGKQVILTVSRLVARKGVANVIGSVRELVRTHPNLAYVVVGDGPERMSLEAQAQGLPVVFTGNVSDAERNAWYQACDMFALTPIADAIDVEGFGIVYLEAMAAGRPIVATRTGGVPEAVGEAGVLLDNFGQLNETLERLLADESERKRLGSLGRERVKAFTWPSLAGILREKLYGN